MVSVLGMEPLPLLVLARQNTDHLVCQVRDAHRCGQLAGLATENLIDCNLDHCFHICLRWGEGPVTGFDADRGALTARWALPGDDKSVGLTRSWSLKRVIIKLINLTKFKNTTLNTSQTNTFSTRFSKSNVNSPRNSLDRVKCYNSTCTDNIPKPGMF